MSMTFDSIGVLAIVIQQPHSNNWTGLLVAIVNHSHRYAFKTKRQKEIEERYLRQSQCVLMLGVTQIGRQKGRERT